LREVYGWRESADPRGLARALRGELGAARRDPLVAGLPPMRRLATFAAVSRHHVARLAGAVLGSRADRLPPRARRALSLERRAGFAALELDTSLTPKPTRDPAK